jgi:hypothetical protein
VPSQESLLDILRSGTSERQQFRLAEEGLILCVFFEDSTPWVEENSVASAIV